MRFERETGKRGHRDLVIFNLLSVDERSYYHKKLVVSRQRVAFIAIDDRLDSLAENVSR